MTDIDIERLRKDAKELAPPGKCSCLRIPFYHQSCAILALIERLEKAEAQRDRLLTAAVKMVHAFDTGADPEYHAWENLDRVIDEIAAEKKTAG